jgi:ribosomal protein S12 methylthiotransferase
MIKVGYISLGCPRNLVDTENLLGSLQSAGFCISDDLEDADIGLINTCAFIKEAKEESLSVIFQALELKKEKKLKRLIVAGCLAQRYQRELFKEIPQIDGFLGIGQIARAKDLIQRVLQGERLAYVEKPRPDFSCRKKVMLTPKHYAYLKIAEGCSNLCSYCAIGRIRGRLSSRSQSAIIQEAKMYVQRGVKEINLIAQDSTAYGLDLRPQTDFAKLLKKISRLPIGWLRVLYTHPRHFQQDLVEVIRDTPNICKYVDLPIQHINDKILQLMQRKITSRQISDLIALLRREIPGITIRTSLIVGFPGEGEKEFAQLKEFVRLVKFDKLGVFLYSREENTPAYHLPQQVPEKIKKQRFEEIMALQKEISQGKLSRFLGKTLRLLVDEKAEKEEHLYYARTEFDAPEVDGMVYLRAKEKIKVGDFVSAKIIDTYEYDLVAKKID